MKALDLFCGAGGASMGLYSAGFDVTGVDLFPQKRYPFRFIQGDATTFPLDGFDFIWASPPCQAFTDLRFMYNAKRHRNLIPIVRARLSRHGVPYVIENVEGAPLKTDFYLCGTMFSLGTDKAELWRHRKFECSFSVSKMSCRHRQKERVIGVYGGHGRDRRRRVNTQDFSVNDRRRAMGIDWMNGLELSQAIPPVYSYYIVKHLKRV